MYNSGLFNMQLYDGTQLDWGQDETTHAVEKKTDEWWPPAEEI